MAAEGEMADPPPNVMAPYSERVQNLGQVEVGELVLIKPIPPAGKNVPPGLSVGTPWIQRISGKVENVGGSPALDFMGHKVKLNPNPKEFMRFEVYRKSAGPAAAGAGPAAAGAGPVEDFRRPRPGGKRRKTKKATRRRRTTRRR
jgi:hypothetical protein